MSMTVIYRSLMLTTCLHSPCLECTKSALMIPKVQNFPGEHAPPNWRASSVVPKRSTFWTTRPPPTHTHTKIAGCGLVPAITGYPRGGSFTAWFACENEPGRQRQQDERSTNCRSQSVMTTRWMQSNCRIQSAVSYPCGTLRHTSCSLITLCQYPDYECAKFRLAQSYDGPKLPNSINI